MSWGACCIRVSGNNELQTSAYCCKIREKHMSHLVSLYWDCLCVWVRVCACTINRAESWPRMSHRWSATWFMWAVRSVISRSLSPSSPDAHCSAAANWLILVCWSQWVWFNIQTVSSSGEFRPIKHCNCVLPFSHRHRGVLFTGNSSWESLIQPQNEELDTIWYCGLDPVQLSYFSCSTFLVLLG